MIVSLLRAAREKGRLDEVSRLTGIYRQMCREALSCDSERTRRADLVRFYPAWLRSMMLSDGPIGDAQPWITFPAMSFLKRVVSRSSRVFEYGAGGSSLFFADRVAELATVEHDLEWLRRTKAALKPSSGFIWNAFLSPPSPGADAAYASSDPRFVGMSFRKYATAVEHYPPGYFDLVLVDGRARPACFRHAVERVRPGGYIVLDNAEREEYRSVEEEARRRGYPIRDCWGPGPYNIYFWKTIFIRKSWSEPNDDAKTASRSGYA